MKTLSIGFLCFLFITGCGSSSGDGEPSSGDAKDVKAVIKGFTDFYSHKKVKMLKELFTEEPEAIVFGMGNEMWEGGETIRKKMEKQIDDIEDNNVDVRDQVLKVIGNTAWFSERGDWSYDYKGQRVKLEGIRITGVLLKQDGIWKIAQWHTSYPVRGGEQIQQQQQ